jgi:tRNA A-37 threonylcarbamoyl transferase component Bud32
VTLAPGSTFGPYKILEPLGRGGMASVFKAYEPGLDRYVALKVLPAQSVQDEASAERFRREAKVIARLEHPNITPIHNFGIDQASQIPWMAMRLISGGTLSSRLTMRMTPQRAVSILRGVGDALDYAHAKGVMHRDVKPANILLDEAGRVYLADFGIARLVEGATALTAAGLISGTPAYMAPEQATGLSLDHRVDIYALGVVAYEVLAGRVPFQADNAIDVLMKHVQSPVPLIPGLPPAVMDALLKALAKKPEERWESAGALVNALEATIALMPVVGAADTTPGMTAVPATQPPATQPPAGPTAMYPAPPAARATSPAPPPARTPDTVAVPDRKGLPMGLILGGALLAVMVAAGLFLALRLKEPSPADGNAAVAGNAAPSPGPLAPVTLPPAAEAIETEEIDPAPVTTVPTARVTTVAPKAATATPLPVSTVNAPAVPATLPATPPAPARATATGTLRLDVNAVQPAFGDMAAVLTIEVRVDGAPLRTVSLRFDGTTPFARSRRRQAFDISGVPVGSRAVSVVVSADRGLDPVQAATRVEMGEAETATLDVRLRGNGDGDAAFR